MAITRASTDLQRSKVQAFFEFSFPGIAPNAVPTMEHDKLYAPLILQALDADGAVIAAAMATRAQVAAGAIMHHRMSGMDPGNYIPVLDAHRELDLIAVAPEHRSQGLGSELMQRLDREMKTRGVKVCFGNVTANLDADKLREFYSRHGFTIAPDWEPLPDLLGRRWVPPSAEAPRFYFYKRIRQPKK